MTTKETPPPRPAGGDREAAVSGVLLTGVSLQGQEHWEEVFAVLEGDVLSLYKDRSAAAQVLHDSPWTEGSLRRHRRRHVSSPVLSWRCVSLLLPMATLNLLAVFSRGSPGGLPSTSEGRFVRRTFTTGGRRTRSD